MPALPPPMYSVAMYSVEIQVHGSGKYFVIHLVQNVAERAGFRCVYSAGKPHDILPQPLLSCRLPDLGMALISVGTLGNHKVNINTYYDPPELKAPVTKVITEVLSGLAADKDVDGVIGHRGSRD